MLRHGARVRVRELRAAGDVVDDPAVVSAADPTKRQVRAFGCCRTCRHPSSLTHRPPPGPSTGGLLAPQPATFEQRALRWARSASFDQSASVALEKRQNSVAAATAISPSSACKIRTIAPQLWASNCTIIERHQLRCGRLSRNACSPSCAASVMLTLQKSSAALAMLRR